MIGSIIAWLVLGIIAGAYLAIARSGGALGAYRGHRDWARITNWALVLVAPVLLHAAFDFPLLALQRDIQRAAAPHLPARGRRRERFVPHASLGQAYSAEDRAAIELEAVRDCRLHDGGISVAVDHVQVMYKPSGARGPYTLYREAALAPSYEP